MDISRFPSFRPLATLPGMSHRVAVIDIGSNSIKLLVADRAGGKIRTILTALEEARISRGISGTHPTLSEQGMSVGIAAVTRLMAAAAQHDPDDYAIVATSAVRDARNGAEFRQRVLDDVGVPVRILSGDEEAELIGVGLVFDPELAGARDFLVCDLGGGSLELLEFRDRHVARAASLQLGCVRLTERCVADSEAPFTDKDWELVVAEVRSTVVEKFPLAAAAGLRVIATGGSVATARAILAAREGVGFAERNPLLSVADLSTLLEVIRGKSLSERQAIAGLPASRADVMPTALVTMIEVARLAGVDGLFHSASNLRFGVAARMLGA